MQHSRTPIRQRAQGRWLEILSGLDIDGNLLTNRGSACPVCGGKDRFRFDDKDGNGTWFCNQSHGTETANANGSAGNGFALVMDVKQCDFAEAAKMIETIIGTDSAPVQRQQAVKAEDDNGFNHADIRALWQGGKPITPEDPAGLYLRRRLGVFVQSRALRFHPAIPYGETTRMGLLSAYVDPHEQLSGLQRTFLTEDGHKATMRNPRLTLGKLPDGGAVRLMRPEPKHTVIGIAEGVETALSASIMHQLPVWAALNSGRLSVWQPPEGYTAVVIFGDNDANKDGQKAAYTLANRLEITRKIQTQVEIPPGVDNDWNDVHREKLRTE